VGSSGGYHSDGSVEADLPMAQLSELFNVNHFIVSQVLPCYWRLFTSHVCSLFFFCVVLLSFHSRSPYFIRMHFALTSYGYAFLSKQFRSPFNVITPQGQPARSCAVVHVLARGGVGHRGFTHQRVFGAAQGSGCPGRVFASSASRLGLGRASAGE